MQAELEQPENFIVDLPKQTRISIGTAIVLGLARGKLETKPTTAYLMTYRRDKCLSNCSFCPQAKKSRSRADLLSRISWPTFLTEQIINRLQAAVNSGEIKRTCIQALNYPETIRHIQALVREIRQTTRTLVSVSFQPLKPENIQLLADAGVDRISVPLDAATEDLFEKVKGKCVGGLYRWQRQLELLKDGVSVFGKWKVSTHLIVGLGETEQEMIQTIQRCICMSVLPALFAFTPIHGTALENRSQPAIQAYRRIQLARHLLLQRTVKYEEMLFDKEGHISDFGVSKQLLLQIVKDGKPFLTSGCPNCNRPYYNEKPSGPIYNYPRDLTEKELSEIRTQLDLD
jgi:biotin synthase